MFLGLKTTDKIVCSFFAMQPVYCKNSPSH